MRPTTYTIISIIDVIETNLVDNHYQNWLWLRKTWKAIISKIVYNWYYLDRQSFPELIMIETNSYTVDDSSRDEVLEAVTRRFPIVRFLIEPKFLTGLGKFLFALWLRFFGVGVPNSRLNCLFSCFELSTFCDYIGC